MCPGAACPSINRQHRAPWTETPSRRSNRSQHDADPPCGRAVPACAHLAGPLRGTMAKVCSASGPDIGYLVLSSSNGFRGNNHGSLAHGACRPIETISRGRVTSGRCRRCHVGSLPFLSSACSPRHLTGPISAHRPGRPLFGTGLASGTGINFGHTDQSSRATATPTRSSKTRDSFLFPPSLISNPPALAGWH